MMISFYSCKDDHLSQNLTLHDVVASSCPPPRTCPGRGLGQGGRERAGRGEEGSSQGELGRSSQGDMGSYQGEERSCQGEESSYQGERRGSHGEMGSSHGEEKSSQGEMGSQSQAGPASLAAQCSAESLAISAGSRATLLRTLRLFVGQPIPMPKATKPNCAGQPPHPPLSF